MKKYNFDQTINRRTTYSVRWDVKEGELPLNIADMDFEVLPEIKEAIKKRSELDCYGYIDTPSEYYEAYIRWWKNRHSLELKKEWFMFSSSVVGSIDTILKTVLKCDEQVVMFTPVYNVFYNCVKNNQLVLKECELIYRRNSFEIDWDKLERLLSEERTKAFIFCNPHNPVGRGFSLEEIDRLINLCNKYDVCLISDEIHCDIDYNKSKYVSVFHSENSDYNKLILLLSPTKIFNVAGLQTSAVLIKDEKLREQIQNALYKEDIGEPNYFAVDPIIAAFTYGEDYVYQLNEYLSENFDYLRKFFAKFLSKLKIIPVHFTYLIWIDISASGLDSKTFASKLKSKTGLIVAPGINYGKTGDNFIRLNIATPRKNIEDACNRLLNFYKEIKL